MEEASSKNSVIIKNLTIKEQKWLFSTQPEFHKDQFLALGQDVAAGRGDLVQLLHEVRRPRRVVPLLLLLLAVRHGPAPHHNVRYHLGHALVLHPVLVAHVRLVLAREWLLLLLLLLGLLLAGETTEQASSSSSTTGCCVSLGLAHGVLLLLLLLLLRLLLLGLVTTLPQHASRSPLQKLLA